MKKSIKSYQNNMEVKVKSANVTSNLCNSGKNCKAKHSFGSRLDSNGMFWITGLVLIGYALSSVIGNARHSGRFSSYWNP